MDKSRASVCMVVVMDKERREDLFGLQNHPLCLEFYACAYVRQCTHGHTKTHGRVDNLDQGSVDLVLGLCFWNRTVHVEGSLSVVRVVDVFQCTFG